MEETLDLSGEVTQEMIDTVIFRFVRLLNEENGDAQRGLFLIDPEGVVKYVLVSAGSVGRSVSETLRVLEAHPDLGLANEPVDERQRRLGRRRS